MREYLTLLLCLTYSVIHSQFSLTIHIDGVKSQDGHFYVALYDHEDTFRKEEMVFRELILPLNEFNGTLVFEDMPEGDYAVALFHDVNANGKLDTKFLGIPKEPYGFSNNPKITFKAPSFSKCKFHINENTDISIVLK